MARWTGMILASALLGLTGCAGSGPYPANGVVPLTGFPVTDNQTPYSRCLADLAAIPANNLPVFAVGEVADRTGQYQAAETNTLSTVVSQGVAEMVMSALFKSGKVHLVERYDLRVPLAEAKMAQQGLTAPRPIGGVRASDFTVVGALTELNYNIVSDGARLAVGGIGVGGRTVVINVAMDLRVIDNRSFAVRYITSLQKQILGYEVEANVFRFFGTQLVEFDAGRIQNEPIQLGVRSVAEMAVYQILTDFLGLPSTEGCRPRRLGIESRAADTTTTQTRKEGNAG